MKVGFTTSDNVNIDSHFGSARTIALYEVNQTGYEFLKILRFDGNLNEDGNEDKLLPKVEALHDCTLVYVSTIGSSAATRLIRHKITPIKAEFEGQGITDVLNKLVQMLNGSPPPWLRKALHQRSPARDELDQLDDLKDTTKEEVTV